MNESGIYKIRPAGRHILTIGRDLIQDRFAAVVELVKNAYDADSPDVNIEFKTNFDHSGYSIIITDHGHGMSRDTVINKWMVPSTDDKLKRRVSPCGRIMQGRKGVGRYAASILGNNLLLETVTEHGEETTVFVEWKDFEDAKYLDDIDILIDTIKTSKQSGTKLIMIGDNKLLSEWDKDQFKNLQFELKKLISPISMVLDEGHSIEHIRINLRVDGFPGIDNINETIEPYPLFDMFDYRISGKISANGDGVLIYKLQKARNTKEEILFNNTNQTGCGELIFDIRVYDRDKESIDSLINRGLKDTSGNYLGNLQARQLLNKYNGIGVYRNGFRIRPLGDPDFDWLRLNEQRIQNPSLKIGSNQVIGYVQIQSDELSGLIEKSARDGLKENLAFVQLKEITKKVIAELEIRRFEYRRKAGFNKPVLKVERELERLFSYEDLIHNIRLKLTKDGVNTKTADEIIEIINRDEEEKTRVAEEIRQAVAIYQGQATLGKIINVILHEGRRPLNYFKNQIPNFKYWNESYANSPEYNKLVKIVPIINGVSQNAEIFVKLFSRLDPLAAGKRSQKKPLNLKKTIKDTCSIFEEEIKIHNITIIVEGPDKFEFSSWPQDIYAIFTNLVDNSLYWMIEKKSKKKEISIKIITNSDALLFIDYRDTGPGIESKHIVSGIIFDPQFTTKTDGTGLGLAIAGEAASRSGLVLKAYESEYGAYFRLQPMENRE